MKLPDAVPAGAGALMAGDRIPPPAAEPKPAEFFEQHLPGGQLKVRVSYLAMRDLLASVPQATEELLGLVWGSYTAQGPSILRFEPLSPNRDWLPDTAANMLEGLGDIDLPIGFFRVQTASRPLVHPAAGPVRRMPGLEMSGSDCRTVREYLSRLPLHRGVFLVIEAADSHLGSAALFALDADWTPAHRAPALVFPFSETARNLRPPEWRTTALPPGPPPPVRTVIPAKSEAPGTAFAPAWIALAGLLLAGAGFTVYQRLHSESRPVSAQNPSSQSNSLALRAIRSGGDIEVSWNHSSRSVSQASRGTLTIHDGLLTRSVPLDGPRLREGKILYTPLSSELSFRLEVETGDHTTEAGSVQVLAWEAPHGGGALLAPGPATGKPESRVP